MSPKVSIIVPCYKVEKYLSRCVESLLNQTLKDIEIILVDDGSPDRVPEICDDYANRYPIVKVIHKKNGGLGYARNYGLEQATGVYVMFVDGDDCIDFDSCNRFYTVAKQFNADVVTGNFNTEVSPGAWNKTEQPEGRKVLRGEEVYHYMLDLISTPPHEKLERFYPVSVCLLFIKRQIIEDNHLRFMSEREVYSEDTVFKVALLKKCNVLVREPYAFYSYYFTAGSLTRDFHFEKFKRLRTLHSVLKDQVKGDPSAELRVDRHTISEVRTQIQLLVQSNKKDKIKILKEISEDTIWSQVSSFKPSYYPMFQRIFYVLTLKKQPCLLYLYTRFVLLIKKLKYHLQ